MFEADSTARMVQRMGLSRSRCGVGRCGRAAPYVSAASHLPTRAASPVRQDILTALCPQREATQMLAAESVGGCV